MSANIKAIQALFSGRQTGRGSVEVHSNFISGRRPYYENVKPNIRHAGMKFFKVIDAIRADPHWSPVYFGDLTRYHNDHSTADLALCGEFARRGLNGMLIDQALRTSALYRDKWERDDYRERTIAKAVEGARKLVPAIYDKEVETPLDLKHGEITVSLSEPPTRDYIIGGLLAPGKSAILGGFGGVSKTQLALQICVAIVLGARFLEKPVKEGRAIAILGEEDAEEISRRVSAVARRGKFSDAQVKRMEENIRAFPMVGKDVRLTSKVGADLKEQPFAEKIISAAKKFGDVRMIVIDHLALVHGGDFNAREDAALTMRVANLIAQETGAAVLILAHTPKSAQDAEESDASMIAGSTAFVDQSRAAWVLATMRENEAKTFGISDDARREYVSLKVVKSNYGPTGDEFWFKRVPFDEVGLLEPVTLSKAEAAAKSSINLDGKVLTFVAQHRGQYSKSRLRDRHSGKSKTFAASKADVEIAIDTLLDAGRLINRPPTAEERKKFNHGPRVENVLDVGP